MALVEVKVPDIGDFKDVEIIELLVKPGDTVKAEQSLITVECDKASMEIPSSHAGVVKELQGQARRQGQRGLAGADARRRGRGRRTGACASAGCSAGAGRGARRRARRAAGSRRGGAGGGGGPSTSSCPTSATSTRSRSSR